MPRIPLEAIRDMTGLPRLSCFEPKMMLCCCKASSDNPRLSIRAAVCNPFLPFPVFLARVLAVQPSSLSKIQNQQSIRRSLGEVGSSFVNLFFFLPADLRSPTSVLWLPLSISSRHPPAIPLIHGCSNHPPGMRSTTTSTRRIHPPLTADLRRIVDGTGGALSPRAHADGSRTKRPA